MTSVSLSVPAELAEEDARHGQPRLPDDAPRLFVVPAYNEEENLPQLLADLERRAHLFTSGSKLFIVDDGSSDGTVAVAEAYDGPLPLELIRLERNQGPGAAFRAGFDAALASCPADALIVTLEADTTGDLDALPTMISRAAAGAELVLASWVMVNVGFMRRILSDGAGVMIRLVLGLEARTVSSFLRVYRASALRTAVERHGDSLICEPGFACKAELLAKLSQQGARIEEVPVELDTSRRVGKSKMPIVRTILAYFRMMLRQRLGRDSFAT